MLLRLTVQENGRTTRGVIKLPLKILPKISYKSLVNKYLGGEKLKNMVPWFASCYGYCYYEAHVMPYDATVNEVKGSKGYCKSPLYIRSLQNACTYDHYKSLRSHSWYSVACVWEGGGIRSASVHQYRDFWGSCYPTTHRSHEVKVTLRV